MEIKAELNYLRVSPRKVRLVADLIKGMEVKQAENHLKFLPQRVSGHLLKLLHSAISNAKNNFKIDKDSLYIKEIRVSDGTPFKRWRPVSRGRAFPIMKRTSHINLILGLKEGIKPKKIEPEIKPLSGQIKKEEVVKRPQIPKRKPPKELTKGSRIKNLAKRVFRRKSF